MSIPHLVIWSFIHPSRVSRVFEARLDLQGKEALEVGWGCQGHRETKDLKDNLWAATHTYT